MEEFPRLITHIKHAVTITDLLAGIESHDCAINVKKINWDNLYYFNTHIYIKPSETRMYNNLFSDMEVLMRI